MTRVFVLLKFLVSSFYDGVFTSGIYYGCVTFIFLSLGTIVLAFILAVLNMCSWSKHKITGPIAMMVVNIVASKLIISESYVTKIACLDKCATYICQLVSQSLNLSTCLPTCLPTFLSVCLSTCLPTFLSVYLSSTCLPTFLSVCLSVHLPAYFPVCLSVCLPACLLSCLSVCLSTCLPTFLSVCLSSTCLPTSICLSV